MIHQTQQPSRDASPLHRARKKRNGPRIVKQTQAAHSGDPDLRKLAAELLQLQDQERRMVARHLNDATGQELAALSVKLALLFRNFNRLDPELASGLLEAIRLSKHASNELRAISYLLHPPLLDEMGLPTALRCYLDGFGKRSNIRVHFELSEDFGRLPHHLEINIFRVAQECLTNIHRHAQSSTAALRLHQTAERITLEVHDHGKGISHQRLSPWSAAGVGMRSIQERVRDCNGEIHISPLPNGTQIKVTIPAPGQIVTA